MTLVEAVVVMVEEAVIEGIAAPKSESLQRRPAETSCIHVLQTDGTALRH